MNTDFEFIDLTRLVIEPQSQLQLRTLHPLGHRSCYSFLVHGFLNKLCLIVHHLGGLHLQSAEMKEIRKHRMQSKPRQFLRRIGLCVTRS